MFAFLVLLGLLEFFSAVIFLIQGYFYGGGISAWILGIAFGIKGVVFLLQASLQESKEQSSKSLNGANSGETHHVRLV